MTKLILASLAAGALLLACGVPVARADTPCTGEETGTISGNVVVPSGATCNLNAATVTGNVTVQSGSLTSLSLEDGSTVEGNVTVQSNASLDLSDSTVTGNVTVQSGASLTMEGSTVVGNISANQCSSVQIVGPNAVQGNVSIPNCTAASGYVPAEDPSSLTTPAARSSTRTARHALPLISIPTLGGNFVCQNNPVSCSAVSVSIVGNMTVDGNRVATVEGNSVGGNVEVNSNASAQVGNNEINNITGNLTCLHNTNPTLLGNNKVHGNTNCR